MVCMHSWTLLKREGLTRAVGVASLALACSDEPTAHSDNGGPSEPDALTPQVTARIDGLNGEDASVITIGDPNVDATRYLAIKRSALSNRWFFSAYMKQFHPGGAETLAANQFGVRIVSFEQRDNRLFVFDSSDRFKASEVANPKLLVDAYEVVRSPAFDTLAGSDEYVLVDPSRRVNDFSVSGNLFGDPHLTSYAAVPLRIGLSIADNYRTLPDGVAFDQVFTGDADLRGYSPEVLPVEGVVDVWGTLGVSLRRYSESEAYSPTEDLDAPHYFQSDSRFTPESMGDPTSVPSRWAFHAGMEPVPVYITAGAKRAQADNPAADILGALQRGIESWNDVFGFRVFEAVFVDDDEIRGEDTTLIVDYPSGGVEFAYANSRANPNTGEIRGGTAFMSGVYFDFSDFEPEVYEEEEAAPDDVEAFPAQQQAYRWGPLSASPQVCRFQRRGRRAARALDDTRLDSALTSDERGVRFVQFVTAHEFGHVIGLRHNFKGSLVAPTSSVMDYVPDEVTDVHTDPGEYDVAAVRYLYQLSSEPPTQPFCADDDTAIDPTCITFDGGADPLVDWLEPRMRSRIDSIFDEGEPAEEGLEYSWLNETLAYARDDEFSTFTLPEQRVEALRIALGRSSVPLSTADAENPAAAEAANAVASFVLRRLVLDPLESRGELTFDVADPGVIQLLSAQAGSMLRNEDGVRSFELRRTAVDVLQALQHRSALNELALSLRVVQEQRESDALTADDAALMTELIGRISSAMTPYFE